MKVTAYKRQWIIERERIDPNYRVEYKKPFLSGIISLVFKESSALHCKPTSYLTHEFPDNALLCGKTTVYNPSSQVRTEYF